MLVLVLMLQVNYDLDLSSPFLMYARASWVRAGMCEYRILEMGTEWRLFGVLEENGFES